MTRDEMLETAAKVAVAAERARQREEDQKLSKDAQAILHKLRQILDVLGEIADGLAQGVHDGT